MKSIIVGTLIGTTLMVGIIFAVGKSGSNNGSTVVNNVTIANGWQIIEINAKGGYSPRQTTAKAGLPTLLRFNTSGTFDCSSAVRVPSLGITKNLPPSGSTDINIGTASAGTLQGTCGMGMYNFAINFQQ